MFSSWVKKYSDTIGRAIKGISLKILDNCGVELKQSEIGAISVKSSWTMINKKSKYIQTGDLGYMNKQGYLFLMGRSDDMIVSGGENVYPQDIEVVLLENPEIESVAVIGVENDDFGKRLNAYIIPKIGVESLNEKNIKLWLLAKLARYQMPDRIFIIEKIPITDTGKLNKKELLMN